MGEETASISGHLADELFRRGFAAGLEGGASLREAMVAGFVAARDGLLAHGAVTPSEVYGLLGRHLGWGDVDADDDLVDVADAVIEDRDSLEHELARIFDETETIASWSDFGVAVMTASGSSGVDCLRIGDVVYQRPWHQDGELGPSDELYFAYVAGDETSYQAFLDDLTGDGSELSYAWGYLDVYISVEIGPTRVERLNAYAESIGHGPWDSGTLRAAIELVDDDWETYVESFAAEHDVSAEEARHTFAELVADPQRRPATTRGRGAAWWLVAESTL